MASRFFLLKPLNVGLFEKLGYIYTNGMRQKIKRATLFVAGMVFLVLGIAGLALPFLQGFLFIAIGLIFLSLWSPRVRDWVESRTEHHPRLHTLVKKTQAWIGRWIGES